ncbi:hypothetical protein [Pantoea eucrina]|uniref:hypothetical protein n=1 Tax=Pantoea eucrina TaxID=472693 RepID=UPI00080F59F0|nr:hypothetical protein [Pantoea eucrina]
MQITFKLTEAELQEAVQQYITNLGVLPKGTDTNVSLTGGGNGKNADYGAIVEFDNALSPAMLAAAMAKPETAAPVKEEVKAPEIQATTPVVKAESAPKEQVSKLSDKSESTAQSDAETANAKSSADTQVSQQAPEMTDEDPENLPFDMSGTENKQSKGISLFNRPSA